MESIEMSPTKEKIPHGTYTVKAGDSLMSIAARVGNVTPAQLARFNKLGMLGVSPPPLFPGQRFYIPNKDELAAQNVRLRRLPGTATRVRDLSGDFSPETQSPPPIASADFFNLQDPSTRTMVNPRKLSSSASGVLERLFVKVDAQRVLMPSKEHIDGILIVTPDAVCFDALATASALNQAAATKIATTPLPASASQPISSTDNCDDDHLRLAELPTVMMNGSPTVAPPDPVLEAVLPVHNVLNLSVCIPIPSLVSLNTHSEIDNLLSVGTVKSTTKLSGQASHFILDVGTVIQTEDLPQAEVPGPTNPQDSASRPPSDLDKVYISLGVDTNRIISSTELEQNTTLSEAASSKTHIFLIPLDRLPDIHDILVSATANLVAIHKAPTAPPTDTVAIAEKRMSQSIVESALREMEDSPFQLTLRDGKSCILSAKMLKDLSEGMPTTWVGYSMRRIFSTAYDGFSLNTLYRKMSNVQPYANILLIQDVTGKVFGAILSEGMHCSQHFYGTGESCVFQWIDGKFVRYDWTKKNYFFMRGAPDCFLIGAKSGHSAIWFDSALKYGRSEATDTFDNPVLCGQSKRSTYPRSDISSFKATSPEESPSHFVCPSSTPFTIDKLEVWEMVT